MKAAKQTTTGGNLGNTAAPPALQALRVSDNRRFLVTGDGSPFFWLGDTPWRLPTRPPADVERYLSHRARHGFNILQVCCGYSATDYSSASVYTDYAGHQPFRGGDTDSPNEEFWQTIDSIVDQALAHRLYLALVPMWGNEYGKAFGADAAKAERYGYWLGTRYASYRHILWIVSGEYDAINGYHPVLTPGHKALFVAAAQGLRRAHGGAQLMTIHPGITRSSSRHFHDEPWLDFNMIQSGHYVDNTEYNVL